MDFLNKIQNLGFANFDRAIFGEGVGFGGMRGAHC